MTNPTPSDTAALLERADTHCLNGDFDPSLGECLHECDECGQAWPCLTAQLATALRASEEKAVQAKLDGRIEGAEAGFDAGADAAEDLRGLYEYEQHEYGVRLGERRREFVLSAKEER